MLKVAEAIVSTLFAGRCLLRSHRVRFGGRWRVKDWVELIESFGALRREHEVVVNLVILFGISQVVETSIEIIVECRSSKLGAVCWWSGSFVRFVGTVRDSGVVRIGRHCRGRSIQRRR
jgi:hypothetical protein